MPGRLLEIGGVRLQVTGRLLRLARIEDEGFVFVKDPVAIVRELRRSPVRIDLFTFMQEPPDESRQHPYPLEWDNVAAIPISTFDAWWTTQINNKARNMVRRAEKSGITTREEPFSDELVRAVHEVYNETPVRQGRPNRHYGKDLATVRREAATFVDQSVWIGAYFEDVLIGFAKVTLDASRHAARVMNFVTMTKHRDKAPANALLARAVQSCAERKLTSLEFGRLTYGRKSRDGLSDFKRRNGFQQIDVPRYYVALTPRGAAAFRLGLHLRLADHLPAPVLDRLLAWRRAWYQRASRAAS